MLRQAPGSSNPVRDSARVPAWLCLEPSLHTGPSLRVSSDGHEVLTFLPEGGGEVLCTHDSLGTRKLRFLR